MAYDKSNFKNINQIYQIIDIAHYARHSLASKSMCDEKYLRQGQKECTNHWLLDAENKFMYDHM